MINYSRQSRSSFLAAVIVATAALPACGPATPKSGVESLTIAPPVSRRFTIMGTAADGLATPRDLAFNPKNPTELWTVNRGTEGAVIFHDAGALTQHAEARADSYRGHFMSQVSSVAFGNLEDFATCQESRNEQGDYDFMGPTLWSSDLAIFANVNQYFNPSAICSVETARRHEQDLLGSHIDMLHQSPLCMGIAHDADNAFWAFDGLSGNLVHYDFVRDHGPGRQDHSDGRIRRYDDVTLTRVAGVPGHIKVDQATQMIYIADTGTGRVLKVNPAPAVAAGGLEPFGEPLAQYDSYRGAVVEEFATGLHQPSGLLLTNDRLYVSDHATGEIIAYNLDTHDEVERLATGARGIMGMAVNDAGQLWFVDAAANTLVRVDAQ